MPDDHDAAGMINELPSQVALPADFFEKKGAVGTRWEDMRQFPRFYLRYPAALEVRPSLPALARVGQLQRVFVKDISRVAIAILHSEQLFPGERLRLTLIDGIERSATVTRCRRIQASCYEVAARLDSAEAASANPHS
jgi:hypothetical protein